MKNLLFILGVAFIVGLFTSNAEAQSRIQVGLRGGVNFATLNDTDVNVDSHTGLMAGIFFDFPIADSPVFIQPEVLYTQKGFERNGRTFRTDYVEVPILARFNFITNSSVLPFVYFGPYLGIKVNTEYPQELIYNAPGPTSSYYIDGGDVNTIDFGVTVGGGLDFGRIDLGIRYEAGLTKISDDDNITAKNGVFSIVAGIGF